MFTSVKSWKFWSFNQLLYWRSRSTGCYIDEAIYSEDDIDEDFLLSKYLSEKLNKEYSSISKVFSQTENITLEQYFILQKIEKVKELLIYRELTLSQIADKLGYKTVQHLSQQFKKITGFSPSQFQELKEKKRLPIDLI